MRIETDEEINDNPNSNKNNDSHNNGKNEIDNYDLSFSNSNMTFNNEINPSTNWQNINFDIFKQPNFGFNKGAGGIPKKLDNTFLIDLNIYKKINKIYVRNIFLKAAFQIFFINYIYLFVRLFKLKTF